MAVTDVAVMSDRDAALIERARGGDQDAFAALIQPRSERVLRMARAIIGDEAAAHDAAQNALVSAWLNLSRLRDPSRFDAWINRVLRNECNLALRRRKRVREIDIATAEVAGLDSVRSPDPSGSSLDSAAVKGAFRRLSVDDRMILLLHHLHDLTLEEVAKQLDVPVGTVKSRLWSARRALERALEIER
jgi:RNA polymerase sigma-70 factor, ECF subfamily